MGRGHRSRKAARIGRAWTTSPSELGLMMQTRAGCNRARRPGDSVMNRELPSPIRGNGHNRDGMTSGMADLARGLRCRAQRYRRYRHGIRLISSQEVLPIWIKTSVTLALANSLGSCALSLSWAAAAARERGGRLRPGPLESSVPERFRLGPAVFSYESEPVFSTPRYTVSKLRFPSPIETPDAENNMVHAEYFAPVRHGTEAAGGDRVCTSSVPIFRSRATWRRGWPIAGWPRSSSSCPITASAGRPSVAPRQAVPLGRHRADGHLDAAGRLRRPAGRGLAGRASRGRPGSGSASPASAWAGSSRRWRPPSTRRSAKGPSCSPAATSPTILWEMPEGAAYRKAVDRVRPDLRGPEGADRPVRSPDLRPPAWPASAC